MKQVLFIIALLLALSQVKANLSFNTFNGDFNSFLPADADIALHDIVTIANYYGCKTWVKNECTECSKGFYFNKKGICC